MPLITIKQGGPANDIEDGVYPVILTELEGPKTIYPANAPEGSDIFEWTFAVDDPGGAMDQAEIQGTSSTASGPKSKMYGWLTALLGGKPPAAGQNFDAPDLVGRRALATIGHNDAGWPRIDQLTAMPAAMLGQRLAAATGVPVAAPPLNMRPAAQQAPPERRPMAVGATAAVDATPDLPF